MQEILIGSIACGSTENSGAGQAHKKGWKLLQLKEISSGFAMQKSTNIASYMLNIKNPELNF